MFLMKSRQKDLEPYISKNLKQRLMNTYFHIKYKTSFSYRNTALRFNEL